ncbi:hypothetical protein Daesc_008406 [Daldinia eschscholtzii]|uniref:LysM domain-containing protein n=1 Tax=Daldinia eschscholtzii TaxID=292717 RepID=A0AAX6MD09_9PEZI
MTFAKLLATPVESCCTCATLLCEVPRYSDSEKLLPKDRQLECCQRVICGICRSISLVDTKLPPGLKDPPSYESSVATNSSKNPLSAPPPYTPSATQKVPTKLDEKSDTFDSFHEPAEDTLHFLNHEHDTITSLSLRYGVPASVLRRTNNITSDHLILGRRTILIPGEYYKGGVSLSPRPVEGEEEEARKSKIRRWMVACKVHEYDVAVLYLEQAGYDLEMATEAFFADEEWERAHPVEAAGRGKGIARRANNRSPYWRNRRG